MPDMVFCMDCKWFIKNEKEKDPSIMELIGYIVSPETGDRSPNESYWDCSHQFNLGKKAEWWGLKRYYKKKPSIINAKNDCVRFEWYKKLDG